MIAIDLGLLNEADVKDIVNRQSRIPRDAAADVVDRYYSATNRAPSGRISSPGLGGASTRIIPSRQKRSPSSAVEAERIPTDGGSSGSGGRGDASSALEAESVSSTGGDISDLSDLNGFESDSNHGGSTVNPVLDDEEDNPTDVDGTSPRNALTPVPMGRDSEFDAVADGEPNSRITNVTGTSAAGFESDGGKQASDVLDILSPSRDTESQELPTFQDTDDPYLDRTIADYYLDRKLGEGGMAMVYHGYQLESRDEVAVKLLSHSLAKSSAHIERFVQEAMVAGKLEHPGVVRVYDVGVFEGTYYLVMEFVEGEPLANLTALGSTSVDAPPSGVPVGLRPPSTPEGGDTCSSLSFL
jgi:hypothetical protein